MRTFRLLDERRSVSYSIILGVWGLILIYAILHDQYIVRIAPEHFTVYHKPLWNIQNPEFLAVAYAFRASIGPGLILGMACAFAARIGSWPKVTPKFVLGGSVIVIVCTEVISVMTGLWVHSSEQTLYPSAWYPDDSLPLLITATIQFSSYLIGTLFSLLLLLGIVRKRTIRQNETAETAVMITEIDS